MKILHTADWHLGKKLETISRFEEQMAVLDEICQVADDQQVDVVLIAGDIFDAFNPPTEADDLFYKTVKRLSNDGKRLVVAIAGNHDSADRIAAPVPLARECGIIMVGYHNSIIPTFKLSSGLAVTRSDEGFVEIQLPENDCPLRIITTPYVNELRLKKELTAEDKELEFRNILANHWSALAGKYCDDEGVNILMTHLFFVKKGQEINEKEESEDEKSILYVGGAQPIYSNNIPKGIQYVALGHLHRKQTISEKPCPIVYSSSPLAYSFSEANQQKYVMIIDAQPKKDVVVESVKLQQGRRLLRNSFSDLDEAVKWLKENQNALVELTIHTETYLTGIEKRRLQDAHDGIVSIIPIVAENEQLTGEKRAVVDLEKNINQLFVDYFEYKNGGLAPNKELLELFNELKGI